MTALRRTLDSRQSVGFVPTMGALHRGHLQLMERARQENDVLVVSIFVNPTQFGPNEDFNKYPRHLERDIELAQTAGVDFIFAPVVDDMYTASHRCYVVPEGFDGLAEGNARPGHFRGVATIVTKLFGIVQPTKVSRAPATLIRLLGPLSHLTPQIYVRSGILWPEGCDAVRVDAAPGRRPEPAP